MMEWHELLSRKRATIGAHVAPLRRGSFFAPMKTPYFGRGPMIRRFSFASIALPLPIARSLAAEHRCGNQRQGHGQTGAKPT
jgi:hypothetical protein